MSATVRLPLAEGGVEERVLGDPGAWERPSSPPGSRIAYAAPHVVADPRGENAPGAPAAIDWDATLAIRRDLWSWGLGVAEALDTAQRGAGLDWEACRELIRRSAAEARSEGGSIVSGASTDQWSSLDTLDEVVDAYLEQIEVIRDAGSGVVMMASRQLAAIAEGPDEYEEVYGSVLSQAGGPVIVHWLGDAFDPDLGSYWGSRDLDRATETLVALCVAHADAIDGVKVSLLDAAREERLREALPESVKVYTGDDYHYPELILGTPLLTGEGASYSHALLGIFGAIAPVASVALQCLDAGDEEGFLAALGPTVPLARHVFGPPTTHYRAGLAFLAWVAGRQEGFTMVGGLQSARSVPHLVEAFRLADAAGLLPDPDLAARRMGAFLATAGAL